MIKNHKSLIVFFFLLFTLTQALICGGNCPDNSCKKCICGSAKKIVSIDEYCAKSSMWDVNCCKCIALRASGGNSHFMKYSDSGSALVPGYYYVGVLPQASNEAIATDQCDS